MNIFSVRNEETQVVITFFGIKFKFKNKIKALENDLACCNARLENLTANLSDTKTRLVNLKTEKDNMVGQLYETHQDFFNYMVNNLKEQPINLPFEKKRILITEQNPEFATLSALFPNAEIMHEFDYLPDLYLLWGTRYFEKKYIQLKLALQYNIPVCVMEDGFLKSITSPHNQNEDIKYRKNLSYTINSNVTYFDSTRPSALEKLLDDENLVITEDKKQRARKCIDKIVSNHLTKYNHQPIFEPKIGREGVKKILVIDQTYGDMSIVKGLAGEFTFENMLEAATKENPNADIIVKTHPDVIAGAIKGYYTGLTAHDNIYPYTNPINPISLIQYCDEVYVCSSQMGFEALMCNKKVHCFGAGFYTGYGLTDDRQKIPRRTTKRTLEEMFYIIYIIFSYYVNPDTGKRCEIEEIIDYIIEKREEYKNEKYITPPPR